MDKKPYPTKLSLSVRIDDITPRHVTISIFSNMIPVEQSHAEATRGLCGNLCMRVDELQPFLERVNPNKLSCREHRDAVKIYEYTGVLVERAPRKG